MSAPHNTGRCLIKRHRDSLERLRASLAGFYVLLPAIADTSHRAGVVHVVGNLLRALGLGPSVASLIDGANEQSRQRQSAFQFTF